MKNTFHFLGALALSAVVAFGAVSCNNTKGEGAQDTAAAASDSLAAKGSIVYIDMTRVMAEYDMANDLRAVVETKVQKGLMTRSVAEVEAEKLQKQEIEFTNYANLKNNEINEELLVMNNQINDAIGTFVAKYNAEKKYAMILVSQGDVPGDGIVTLSAPVLTADPSLDITNEVLAGLNEEYIASKNAK